MALPFLFSNYQCLLICLTLSSRKDLSITPCFIEGFSFHMQGTANCKDLLFIESHESFLKVQD
jgi:hypothetical protein